MKINRRHFLSLSALAPLMPALDLRCLAVPAPLCYLPTFCLVGGPESRRWLTAPFGMTGFVGASDGRVLVRVPQLGAVPSDDAPSDVESCPWRGPWLPPFRILSLPELPEWVECVMCGKTGPQLKVSEWDDAFCYGCEGEGIQPQPPGELPGMDALSPHRYWNQRYIGKILALPGPVTFALPQQPSWSHLAGDEVWSPMYFRWAHGDGLLMPLVNSAIISDRCHYQFQIEPA